MDKNTIKVALVIAVVGVVSLFCEPSGLCENSMQCFIGSLISGGLSVLGGGISALVGNAQAKKAQEKRDLAETNLKDWYSSQMNTNVLDRADSMSMLKAYRDIMEEQNKKYNTNAIKGGATEEAKVAYAQETNKGLADAISKISAQGQQRKDQVADAYMQGMMNIRNNEADAYLQSGQQMSNAISGAFNGLSSALSGAKLPTKKQGE